VSALGLAEGLDLNKFFGYKNFVYIFSEGL